MPPLTVKTIKDGAKGRWTPVLHALGIHVPARPAKGKIGFVSTTATEMAHGFAINATPSRAMV